MSVDRPSSAGPAPEAGTAPPGWYPTPWGARWWDGTAWGPMAPAAGASSDEKTLAVLSHLGSVVGGFILPLVLYLVCKEDKPFGRHHAREALNFQLTVLLVTLVGMAVAIPLFVAGAASSGSEESSAGFVLVMLVFFAVFGIVSIGGLVFGVMGALAASRLEWWRYPIAVRFVKR